MGVAGPSGVREECPAATAQTQGGDGEVGLARHHVILHIPSQHCSRERRRPPGGSPAPQTASCVTSHGFPRVRRSRPHQAAESITREEELTHAQRTLLSQPCRPPHPWDWDGPQKLPPQKRTAVMPPCGGLCGRDCEFPGSSLCERHGQADSHPAHRGHGGLVTAPAPFWGQDPWTRGQGGFIM